MSNSNFWFSTGEDSFEIANSLRFRGGQILYRQPAQRDNIYTSTVSFWYKKAKGLVGGSNNSIGYVLEGYFNSTNRIVFFQNYTNTYYGDADGIRLLTIRTSQIGGVPGTKPLRDTNGWYHVVLQINTGVSSGTAKIWVNNVLHEQSTVNSANNYPFFPWYLGAQTTNAYASIGRYTGTESLYLQGQLAEYHVTENLKEPTDFGEYNNQGVWVPKEYTGGGYGINGFYLKFDDPSDLGKDSSNSTSSGTSFIALGFDTTTNNASATAEARNDLTQDTPTNNLSKFDDLIQPSGLSTTSSNYWANYGTQVSVSNSNIWMMNTFNAPITGKKYAEFTFSTIAGANNQQLMPGITKIPRRNGFPGGGLSANDGWGYFSDSGNFYTEGATIGGNSGDSFAADDRIGVAVDRPNNTLEFYKNGTKQGNTINIQADVDYYFGCGCWNNAVYIQSNDSNVDPPAGFDLMYSDNEASMSIVDPRDYLLCSRNTTAQLDWDALTTANPQASYVFKRSNGAVSDWQWANSVVSATNSYQCPSNANGARADFPSSTTDTATAFSWILSSNEINSSTGDLTAVYRNNPTSGHSAGRYTGNNAAGNQTFEHGCGGIVDFMIIKDTTNASGFAVYHRNLSNDCYIRLDSNIAQTSDTTVFDERPGNSLATVGSNALVNGNGNTYAFWCWRSIRGYSKFGAYTSNNSGDGPKVFLGFRPAFVMFRRINSTSNWISFDDMANPTNATSTWMSPNLTNVESNNAAVVDFLSDGFKLRSNTDGLNGSNNTIIYAAWARHPFGGSNVAPAPAF